MLHIRKTKTASGSIAVQVVIYRNRKTVILKHLGSAKTKQELIPLLADAQEWIKERDGQLTIFSQIDRDQNPNHFGINRCVGMRYFCAHTVLAQVLKEMGFTALGRLLLDLVIMRVFEPSSKLRAIELLSRYFGIRYARRTLYRELPKMLGYKEEVERITISFARKQLNSDLSFVLYDVTTLYFESFEPDNLRKHGFSKDNKPQQPQIVIGLLVNADGFPLQYEIFPGNTFEGKTMLLVLQAFRKNHKTESCCVVADAAMMSLENMDKLKKEGYEYIVGARVANLSPDVIDTIADTLKKQIDGISVRIPTLHGDLIASFSSVRYRKDKSEMNKQIAKAERLIAVQEPGRRAKFVTSSTKSYELNQKLIEKTGKLLGIKGYYTNILQNKMSNEMVIAHYGNLWRVEHAFRMSKSDLIARPIFHHKEDSVKAHMVICFIALALGKYMELKGGLSLRRIVDLLRQVQDARIINTYTKKETLVRAMITKEVKRLLKKIGVSY